MAWSDFAYTPATGLSDVTTFVSKPASGTAARAQPMTLFNQITTFLNGTVKNEIAAAAAFSGKLELTLPVVNLDYSGDYSTEAMAASCAVGDVLYLSATGYNKAKADADATLPCCGLCVETGTGSRKILKRGFFKNTAWSFTVGAQIYVSTATAGAITATKPTTTGNRINPVGVAVAADTIWFNPTPVFVEVP